MKNAIEIEVKLRLPDRPAMLERIDRLGFRVSAPRQFEANTLYDSPDHNLGNRQMLLRLRQLGGQAVITWKGPGDPGPYKSRPECETSLGSLETMHQILTQIGFAPTFRYEKYRTEFAGQDGGGVVTLDETPIGDFLELEGPGEWIDQTADRLGFAPQDYILDSYGRLYLADCARRGVEPSHMLFASRS